MKWAYAGLLAVSAMVMWNLTGRALATYQLMHMSDAGIQSILSAEEQPTRSAAFHELLAERAVALEPPDIYSAEQNVLKSLTLNRHSPYAWAHLAYLQTIRQGQPTESALLALEQSIRRCMYCDIRLVKWRLEYMLTYWDQLPARIQAEARHHARIINADPAQHDYLRGTLTRAGRLGIDLGIETSSLAPYSP